MIIFWYFLIMLVSELRERGVIVEMRRPSVPTLAVDALTTWIDSFCLASARMYDEIAREDCFPAVHGYDVRHSEDE